MATTPHIAATLLEQAQAQKEVTINEALARIDALLNTGIVDRDLATPPSSPANGVVYLVAANATGAWAGKAGQLAYFDQAWRFIVPNEGLTLWVNDENITIVYDGTAWIPFSGGVSGGGDAGKIVQARLTLTSGVAVTTSDVTAATTLYLTPYRGNQIALFNGVAWVVLTFTERSVVVPSTANTNYDVFAYNNSGTVTLELTAWANDTTRATALALHDGILVKNGATTRRYLGTVRTGASTGQMHDSKQRRFVWNYYHRLARTLSALESAASWTYSVGAWRQANNSSTNRVEMVIGLAEEPTTASLQVMVSNSTTTLRGIYVAIGIDTVSSPNSTYGGIATTTASQICSVNYLLQLSVGYHYLVWMEMGAGADTQTWSGSSLFGLTGTVVG